MIHLSVGVSEEKLDNVVYMPYNLWFKLVNRKLDILSPESLREVMYTCIIYFDDRNTELGLWVTCEVCTFPELLAVDTQLSSW